MKKLKLLFAAIALVSTLNATAQDYSKLKEISLADSVSCVNAQNQILECSNYLLTTPCVENLPALESVVFIIDWMGATANYSFSLEPKFYKIIKDDTDLVGRYYAALAKTAIENNYKNGVELQVKAMTEFLNYCELAKNKVKISKKIQKYIDAKNANKLKDLIEI